MIEKELFVKLINGIREEKAKYEKFHDELYKLHITWDYELPCFNVLMKVFEYYFPENAMEYIEWFIWEYNEGNMEVMVDGVVKYNLNTAESLYDFLMEDC